LETDQYDVDIAQKYAYYYPNKNSYYNQNNPNNVSSGGNGLLAIPFLIAFFTFLKYFLTLLFVPAIPAMFAGYKISLLLQEPNTPTKLLFIFSFGFLSVVLQLGLIRLMIDFIFKKEFVKWILYIIFYAANVYLIFLLAEKYPVKDLVHTKQTLFEVYDFIMKLF
jgi:hypothetical protein